MASGSYHRGSFSDTCEDAFSVNSLQRRSSHNANLALLDPPTFFAHYPCDYDTILRLPTPTFPKSPSAPTFAPFTFSDLFYQTSLAEESASEFPCSAAPLGPSDSVHMGFDHFPSTPDCPPTPPPSMKGSPAPETICPDQLFFDEDKQHAYAQDALRARLTQECLRDVTPPMDTISPRLLMQHTGLPTPPASARHRKRSRREESSPHPEPASPLIHRPRAIAPIPRRATVVNQMQIDADNHYSRPPFIKSEQPFTPSPSPPSASSSSSSSSPDPYFSSPASSPRFDSDTECEADDEYCPSSDEHAKKRQKSSPSASTSSSSSPRRVPNSSADRQPSGRKTQLQIVLESFPFKYENIKRVDNVIDCPFEHCYHKTTSEGDLGRHLESSAHATHNYLCLAADCLQKFAREDSMKRHHSNNRGKPHKAEHDRMVRLGYPYRVRKEQVEETKERVLQLARSQGRDV